jgi:SPP1 gp7 family putative phage head morphogenesis protein
MSKFLADAATRHAILVQRYADGQAIEASRIVKDVAKSIAEKLAVIDELGNSGQLTMTLESVQRIINIGFQKMTSDTMGTVSEFTAAEVSFSANMIQVAATVPLVVPDAVRVEAAILRQVMDAPDGRAKITIAEALNQFHQAKSAEILQVINDGVLEGLTGAQTAENVSELVTTRTKRQAGTLTRTIINHVSNQARAETIAENQGLLDGYRWLSTLDSRTTLICGGRDGIVYPIGKGPLPPAHWGCRSTTIPEIKDEFSLFDTEGKRPSVGPGGAELVSAKTDYGQWLKKQPKSFQVEVLGNTRAKLFRDGGLKISNFRDETGRIYTLDELKALEPMAFEKANI